MMNEFCGTSSRSGAVKPASAVLTPLGQLEVVVDDPDEEDEESDDDELDPQAESATTVKHMEIKDTAPRRRARPRGSRSGWADIL
jgi:hypothetical protein